MRSVLVVYRSRMNRAYAMHRCSEREFTMTRLEHGMHTATVHTTRGWDGASRIAWRSLLATVGGAFGVVLLATPCYAQTAATGVAETSVSGLPSVEVGGATEHGNAIRPFRINVPEEALADLRRRVVAKALAMPR